MSAPLAAPVQEPAPEPAALEAPAPVPAAAEVPAAPAADPRPGPDPEPWDLYEVDPQRYASGLLMVRAAAFADGERAALDGRSRVPGVHKMPRHFWPDWRKGWDRGREHMRSIGHEMPLEPRYPKTSPGKARG